MRVTVPDEESARAIYRYKLAGKNADCCGIIHFSARLCRTFGGSPAPIKSAPIPATSARDDKVKLSPMPAAKRGATYTIGVNSGSPRKAYTRAIWSADPEALAESALYRHIAA